MESIKNFLENDKAVKNLITILAWVVALITCAIPFLDGFF